MKDARLIQTEVLLPKPKRSVRETLIMPDEYECYVDTPPSVMLIPVTEDQQLALVRQYRHNLKSGQLEFPAGAMHQARHTGVFDFPAPFVSRSPGDVPTGSSCGPNPRRNLPSLQQLADIRGIAGQDEVGMRCHQRYVCVDHVTQLPHHLPL
jgi:hypothetical protein